MLRARQLTVLSIAREPGLAPYALSKLRDDRSVATRVCTRLAVKQELEGRVAGGRQSAVYPSPPGFLVNGFEAKSRRRHAMRL